MRKFPLCNMETAISFAREGYGYKYDKMGRPALLHPIRVLADASREFPDDTDLHIVAVLHDIVEDSDVSIDTLSLFFNEDVVRAIYHVTKLQAESYEDYLHRCCKNKMACIVKRIDMEDNLSRSKNDGLKKLVRKYVRWLPYVINREDEWYGKASKI